MSRKSRMQDLRAKKDRRMKIVAIGGAVVLAIMLAWELPHYLGGSKSPAATTTTSASSDGTTTTPTTGVPTTASGTAAAAVVPASSAKLENSDVQPARTKSQLYSFNRFASKNPFVPQVSASSSAASASPGSTATSSPSTPASAPSAPTSPSGVTGSAMAKPANVVSQPTSASLEVNGKIETVQLGSPFPTSNPVFKLVSLTGKGAKIGISNGGFSNGRQAVSVPVGRSLTLVNKSNGRRYVVLLLSVS
jgi:hypothetical protein